MLRSTCLFLSVFVLICCDHLNSDEWVSVMVSKTQKADAIGLTHDVPSSSGVSNTIKKATQMASLKWIPKNPVPNMLGDSYPAGIPVYGVPYSSGKELCTFVGQDISFYTFLSAVNNPGSYLYSEDTSRPPYNSSLCRSYYGTVCSAAVDYALGLPIQYTTYMYKELPFFSVVKDRDIDSIQLCDLLLEEGHVGMIIDIVRNQYGKVNQVSVFESIHSGTTITEYTRAHFKNHWRDVNWELLRYDLIEKNECALEENDSDSWSDFHEVFNPSISTAKGDRVSYTERDSVIINILDNSEGNLVVRKDDEFYTSVPITTNTSILKNLPAGEYEVFIQKDSLLSSRSVFFEVVNTLVDLKVGSKVSVAFKENNATPIYVVFCQLTHRYLSFHEISSADRDRGFVLVDPEDRETYYCKVLFQGKYGRVASRIQVVR